MRGKHGAMLGQAHCERSTATLYDGQKICLFDVKRVLAGKISYDLLESIKDGMITQTKYEVVVKVARHPSGSSHLVLFMNRYPDLSALSFDRWHIIDEFDDDKTIFDLFPPARFPEVANLIDPFDACYASYADTFGLASGNEARGDRFDVQQPMLEPPREPPRQRRRLQIAN